MVQSTWIPLLTYPQNLLEPGRSTIEAVHPMTSSGTSARRDGIDPPLLSVRSVNPVAAPQDHDRMELRVFDRRVTVLLPRQDDPEQRAHLHRAWSRCLLDAVAATRAPHEVAISLDPAPPVVCDLRRAAAPPMDAAGHARLGDRVTTTVTTRAMESVLGDHLLLHSAGLSAPDGRVLALCAPPGTGKTTATRVLGRRLGYVTDETVCVEPGTGRVLPYPKPLQIIDPGISSRKVAVGPDELGLQEPADLAALHLGPVIVLDRSLSPVGGASASISPLPLAEALPRIVAQTSSLHLLERPLQTLCALMDASGGPWLLRYAEAETLPQLLEQWLIDDATSMPGPERWEPMVSAASEADAAPPAEDSPGHGPETIRRADVQDAVAMPGGIGVLHGGSFFLLQGIGATLWQLLGAPRTVTEIAGALVETHGPTEDAETITADLVEELIGHRVLARSAAPVPPVLSQPAPAGTAAGMTAGTAPR